MKYLFVKFCLFLFCCLLTVHVLSQISNHFTVGQTGLTASFRTFEKAIHNYTETSDDYTSFIVGSSHARVAIDHEVFLGAEYGWSRPDQDIFESRYIIENTVPIANNLERIFVSISYFTFVYDNKVRDNLRVRYYSLPGYRPMKTDWHNFIIGKSLQYFPITSLARNDNWKNVWYGIRTEKGSSWLDYFSNIILTDPLLASTNTYGITIDNSNNSTQEDLTLMSNCRHSNYNKMVPMTEKGISKLHNRVKIMSDAHPNITIDTYNELEKIISFTAENDVEVIFFTPPYHSIYTEGMRREIPFSVESIGPERLSYIDLTNSFMNLAREKYNIKYYDFSHDLEFMNTPELFADASHLNDCGKRLFSIKLQEAIRKDVN